MTCRICGAALPPEAMFCGECGSSTSATAYTRTRQDPRPGDTTIIEPLEPRQVRGLVLTPPPAPEASVAPEAPPAPEAAPAPAAPPAPSAVPGAGPGSEAEPEPEPTPAQTPTATPTATPAPASVPAPPSPDADAVAPARFVLRFSTGQVVIVSGTGLIGRRPLPQPTEYFDDLITLEDRGLSVSKSHLEFGQHGGELWVSDRFSGNGTIIRRPTDMPMRCEPGRRYLVPRGSRVDIGEQNFTVE